MRIKKGDTVVIRRGRDRGTADKLRTGKVLHVFPGRDRVIVEGINLMKRHTRPTQRNPKGGVVTKEAPIHRSNIALYCKSCDAPAKISFKVIDSEDKTSKIRLCRKCGEAI
ncbi:MAG: 50S ribosomal protein L24 [Candidatus Zixiibacteriota bacterium]